MGARVERAPPFDCFLLFFDCFNWLFNYFNTFLIVFIDLLIISIILYYIILYYITKSSKTIKNHPKTFKWGHAWSARPHLIVFFYFLIVLIDCLIVLTHFWLFFPPTLGPWGPIFIFFYVKHFKMYKDV